jgi:hypothetical protein
MLRTATPMDSFTKAEATAYRKSALWCPTWEADHPEIQPEVTYADRFKNGYGYNIYFSFTSSYPNPDAMPPVREIASARQPSSELRLTASTTRSRTERPCQPPARRRFQPLDSRLGLTNAKVISRDSTLMRTFALAHADTPGGLNIDRFRQGSTQA